MFNFILSVFSFPESFLQATSDKTASANFTQTGNSTDIRGIANNLTNGKTGYHPFYQWGRKDAFRSAQYTAAPAANTSLIYSGTSVTIGTTIKNPTTFYNSGGSRTGSPYVPIYYNAWNATYPTLNTTTDKIDGLEKVVKTVYDPCPVGYSVSPGNTFVGMSTSNTTEDGNGRSYTVGAKKLYIPATGQRDYPSGGIAYLNYGHYWLAVPNDETNARIMMVTKSTMDGIYVIGGTCYSKCYDVRPVREK